MEIEKHLFTKCLKCNRILKNKLAQERGYGNHCWKLHTIEVQRQSRNLLNIKPE